jgi:hypothetical protein
MMHQLCIASRLPNDKSSALGTGVEPVVSDRVEDKLAPCRISLSHLLVSPSHQVV